MACIEIRVTVSLTPRWSPANATHVCRLSSSSSLVGHLRPIFASAYRDRGSAWGDPRRFARHDGLVGADMLRSTTHWDVCSRIVSIAMVTLRARAVCNCSSLALKRTLIARVTCFIVCWISGFMFCSLLCYGCHFVSNNFSKIVWWKFSKADTFYFG